VRDAYWAIHAGGVGTVNLSCDKNHRSCRDVLPEPTNGNGSPAELIEQPEVTHPSIGSSSTSNVELPPAISSPTYSKTRSPMTNPLSRAHANTPALIAVSTNCPRARPIRRIQGRSFANSKMWTGALHAGDEAKKIVTMRVLRVPWCKTVMILDWRVSTSDQGPMYHDSDRGSMYVD
jgi:hypothetical protein